MNFCIVLFISLNFPKSKFDFFILRLLKVVKGQLKLWAQLNLTVLF